jgi:predicted nucleic acid-binding protein
MSRETQVVAPGLLRCEPASALGRKAACGLLQEADARRALVDPPELPRRAFDLACRLHLPTASDVCYLALTEIGGGEFWTADERLYLAVRDAFPTIRRLGEAL